ncbi:hypothetical protein, partial [Heyndrickxia coagulans]|uniref:hypothetical protein n=1 Tax=Heyndrickxia coagulans TaxID=1398 RepID=UPI001F19BC79
PAYAGGLIFYAGGIILVGSYAHVPANFVNTGSHYGLTRASVLMANAAPARNFIFNMTPIAMECGTSRKSAGT